MGLRQDGLVPGGCQDGLLPGGCRLSSWQHPSALGGGKFATGVLCGPPGSSVNGESTVSLGVAVKTDHGAVCVPELAC